MMQEKIKVLYNKIPELTPRGVELCISIIDTYLAECMATKKVGSLNDFIKSIPRIIATLGPLADIILDSTKLTSYRLIGKTLEASVEAGFYKYHEGESISQFDIDFDLITDVKIALDNYAYKVVEFNHKKRIKTLNTNRLQ